MGQQIIKQPDGKYCRYSTYVDSFVITDATAREIIDDARTRAADDAEEQIKKALTDADEGKSGGFRLTWDEAVDNHNQHSEPAFRIRLCDVCHKPAEPINHFTIPTGKCNYCRATYDDKTDKFIQFQPETTPEPDKDTPWEDYEPCADCGKHYEFLNTVQDDNGSDQEVCNSCVLNYHSP